MSYLGLQKLPGPPGGSWVPPPCRLIVWGQRHTCLSPWAPSSWLLTPRTVSLSPARAGRARRAPITPTWPPSSWAQHLISISVDLAITHPSSASSIILASGPPLAARALYMVGFHSFVCTFGEGLLCARPCARHRVNGHCPWECTPRGDTREPSDGREPGPGPPGDVVQRRGDLTAWGQGQGGAQLSGVWKEGSHVPPLPCWGLTSQKWL